MLPLEKHGAKYSALNFQLVETKVSMIVHHKTQGIKAQLTAALKIDITLSCKHQCLSQISDSQCSTCTKELNKTIQHMKINKKFIL